MMKYVFFCTGARAWYKLTEKLHDDNVATPILWVGDPSHEPAARAKYGADVVQSMDMFVHFPWRITDTEYEGEYDAFFSSKEYYRAKDRALKMMDRLDIYGSYSRLDREVYFRNICMWGLKKIGAAKPDAIIVTEAPHSHAQYTLFEICRHFKIPAFKFDPWAIVPIMALRSYDDNSVIKTTRQELTTKHQTVLKAIGDYVNKIKDLEKNDKYEVGYIKNQRLDSQFPYSLRRYFSKKFAHMWLSRIYHRIKFGMRGEYFPVAPSIVNLLSVYFTASAKRSYMARNFRANLEKNPDLTQKYVYFGLHYEPERTTNPDGAEFHDQVLSLIKLRRILPDDVLIYVKEHPSQFYSSMKGVQGRSPSFYSHIKNIKGVRIVGMEQQSLDLIRNSLFVATITGSIAMEASILGKKSLVFGSAWYDGTPNILRWGEDLTLDDILRDSLIDADGITQHLIEVFESGYALACQNTSAEWIFASYVDEEFRELESAELYRLFLNLHERLMGAKAQQRKRTPA